jgi:hypothetical protein
MGFIKVGDAKIISIIKTEDIEEEKKKIAEKDKSNIKTDDKISK